MRYIDLRSDTVTMPTEEMRAAMMSAEVGDDVYGDDISAVELERYSAELLKKEAAMFVPSGTFGNQVCIMAHTRRGDEILVEEQSHILLREAGASAILCGVQTRGFNANGREIDVIDLEKKIRGTNIHEPRTGLICLENARLNGVVLSLDSMKKVKEMAQRRGVPVHLDGARLFNAAAVLKAEPYEIASCVDSVMFCLSKGLCAPVGSMVVGTSEFIENARRRRKVMGGGMRQIGFLCAAGLYALKNMRGRLTEDHENAKYLASRLEKIDGILVDYNSLDINMVYFTISEDIITGEELASGLYKRGVKMLTGHGRYRLVTNQTVGRKDIDAAADAIKELVLHK